MKCYQCSGTALLCENVSKRLFCNAEHHAQYYEGWDKLLGYLNENQSLKNEILHLCMKRTRPVEEEEEITIDILESLPMELLIMVLEYAYPRLGESKSETYAAIEARKTSFRVADAIAYLCSKVKRLSYKVVEETLNDETIVLFNGLEKLRLDWKTKVTRYALPKMTSLENLILDMYEISDDVLRQMTWLKKLTLFFCGAITDKGIETLSRLQSLSIRGESSLITKQGFCVLAPHLKELSLFSTPQLRDADIACLSKLTKLALYHGTDGIRVSGTSFSSFPLLETLMIEANLNVGDEQLGLLANHLKVLVFDWNKRITDRGLALMTNLESLSLQGDSLVSDESLRTLTRLRTLNLGNRNRQITDRGLSTLSNLTSLVANRNITLQGLAPFAQTLEHIELNRDVYEIQSDAITPPDFVSGFPNLKSIKKMRYAYPKIEKMLAKRGVRVYF